MSLSRAAATAAATTLVAHRLQRRALPPLPPDVRPTDPDAGYAVQALAHAQLVPTLGAVVGHKIGCTTAVMQAFLDIPSPCAGGVFARTVHASPAVLPHADYVRVGVECEIVARLGADLPARETPWTATAVADAVDALLPGMEIVDERIDGIEVGRGTGADVMGHPFEALAWLANLRAAQQRALRAGEFVFLGSVVATRWVEPGAHVQMTLDPLGDVEARFPC
ncbi:MAG: hypothetical protein MUF30_04180 [Burkholderiales bacterium]|nr:hypothetical protein [Burkholderiales bacterium]